MTALKKAIERLRSNSEQWEAYDTNGHVVVLAPPGSGKTSLLTTKLASSLSTSAGPRGAVCITMTNEAAFELRRRLRAIGVPRRPNLFIGTVHAFALSNIIRAFAGPCGRSELLARRLASGAESDEILEEKMYAYNYQRRDFRSVSTMVDRARQRLDLSGDPLLGGNRIASVALAYQDAMESRGLIDFLDIVRYAVEIVEGDESVRRTLNAAFPLIFVDEYQDLAPGLDRLVRALALSAGGEATLFAVGDPDQSIYGFAGAHPELLTRLADEPNVTKVRLVKNYRSGQNIINSSLRAIGEERTVSGPREGGSVDVHPAPGGEIAQARKAAELVQVALDQGVAAEEIAVITSWRQDQVACATELRAHGVPVFTREDGAWRTTGLTTLIERSAAWTVQDGRDELELGDLLHGFSAYLTPNHDRHYCLTRISGILLNARGDAPARDFVSSLRDAGLSQVLERLNEDALEFAAMLDALHKSPEVATMTIAQLGAKVRAPDRVMVATIHGVKGLEFDVVVFAGADAASIDGFSPTAEEIAESRRKFYVAVTRARNEVKIVYTDKRTSKAGNTYSVGPSKLISIVISNGYR